MQQRHRPGPSEYTVADIRQPSVRMASVATSVLVEASD
jgi:hypothetical protein